MRSVLEGSLLATYLTLFCLSLPCGCQAQKGTASAQNRRLPAVEGRTMEKFDQRLTQEISLRRQVVFARDGRHDGLSAEPFNVTIEMSESLEVPRGLPREQALGELTGQMRESQAGLVEVLEELGVEEFEQLVLSNSIKATLTFAQLTQVAARPDVKTIRLVRAEKVTATPGP